MLIKIELRTTSGKLLFEFEKLNNTTKDTLLEAIRRGIDLNYIDLKSADLRNANLSGVELISANLMCANLNGADLSKANLKYSDLNNSDLIGANLKGAALISTNLLNANLKYADLSDSGLVGANLRGANLKGANLKGAVICNTNLSGAYLKDTNLNDIIFNELTSFLLPQCLSEGSFIGWKKSNRHIIKLLITEKAKRSSSTSLKCRCSEAKVLEIQNKDGSKSNLKEIESEYDKNFIYKVGEIVRVEDFDEDRFNECSKGIHFFISRELVVIYY